jgi:hypothetical protein
MNWQRGFFRLWLVLSALWIAVSWWLTEPIFKMQLATTDHVVFNLLGQGFDFPPNTKRAVVERVLTNYARDKLGTDQSDQAGGSQLPPGFVRDKKEPSAGEALAARLGLKPPATSEKPIEQRVAEAIGSYRAYSWPALIFRAWGPIVLPPFGLMLVAIIVAWVVRGFRRPAD